MTNDKLVTNQAKYRGNIKRFTVLNMTCVNKLTIQGVDGT